MSGWGGWYHSAGTYVGRDRFTATRHWSFWFFADWRLGVVIHGLDISLLVLPQRPRIDLNIGWTGDPGRYEIHLGWVHAQTRRLSTREEWAEMEARWDEEEREDYERLREKFGGATQ